MMASDGVYPAVLLDAFSLEDITNNNNSFINDRISQANYRNIMKSIKRWGRWLEDDRKEISFQRWERIGEREWKKRWW